MTTINEAVLAIFYYSSIFDSAKVMTHMEYNCVTSIIPLTVETGYSRKNTQSNITDAI